MNKIHLKVKYGDLSDFEEFWIWKNIKYKSFGNTKIIWMI
jgi:hypothetical protein